ncbi:MAG: DUF669 domain-containing protein [Sneathiella sp.]
MGNLGTGYRDGDDFERTSFDIIRPGRYMAQIVDSDVSPNKTNTGYYAKFEFELLDNGAENRKIWEYVNFEHEKPSVKAQGQNAMKVIQKLCRLPIFDDTTLAHNTPFYVEVKVEPAKDGYEASNKIDFNKMKANIQNSGPSSGASGGVAASGNSPSAQGSNASSPQQPGQGGMPWAN